MNKVYFQISIKLLVLTLSIMMLEGRIIGAPFKAPSSLVNMPVAQLYKAGDIDLSVATGINSIKEYQFDISLLYAVNERLKGGVTLINYQKAIFNVQATFIDIQKYRKLKVSGGILNLTSDSSLSTWDNEKSVNSNHMMHFLVGSQEFFGGLIHYGISKRRQKGTPSILNGLLFGFSKKIKKSEIILDFDGVNANFGVVLKDDNETSLTKMAFSNPILNSEQSDNENLFSIQFTRRFNIFKKYSAALESIQEEYNNFQELEKEFQEMKKNLTKDIEELKENKELLAQEVEKLQSRKLQPIDKDSNNEVNKEKQVIQGYSKDIQAMMYYQEAEERFKNEEYYEAIQQLELAIELTPQEQHFYIVLGSMYYKLKNKKKAYRSWAQAYELDPTSKALDDMPSSVKKEIIKEIMKKKKVKDER